MKRALSTCSRRARVAEPLVVAGGQRHRRCHPRLPRMRAAGAGSIEQALNVAEMQNAKRLIFAFEELRHGLNVDPEYTVLRADGIIRDLDSTAADAVDIHARASRFQWMSALGQAEQGTSEVRVDGQTANATKIDFTRVNSTNSSDKQSKLGGILPNNRGHLRIRGSLAGESAAFYGISDEMAVKILGEDLSNAPFPILLIVNGGGLISRDEVGRIRSHDLPLRHAGSTKEEQNYEYSKQILDRVLAVPLSSSVKKIVTDDDASK